MDKINQQNLDAQDGDVKTTNVQSSVSEPAPVDSDFTVLSSAGGHTRNQLGNQSDNNLSNSIDNQSNNPLENSTNGYLDNSDAQTETHLVKSIQKSKKKNKKNSKLNSIINWFLLVCIVILAAAIIFLNVFTLCPVSGESMLPNIVHTQRVLLLRTTNAKNGDIIVFQSAKLGTNGKNLIKRVIASGGNKLLFVASSDKPVGKDNRIVYLYRDCGEGFFLLDESEYILENMYFDKTPQSDFCKIYQCANPALLFVNGHLNTESNAFQSTSKESISNTDKNSDNLKIINNKSVVFNENPQDDFTDNYEDYIITIEANHYYAMGDNRNVSNDSRDYTVGFVHKDDVIGREVMMLQIDSFLEKLLMFMYRDSGDDRELSARILWQ